MVLLRDNITSSCISMHCWVTQRRTHWCMLKEDMQRGRWGIMVRCQKIRLTWKTLANTVKSTALLMHMSWTWSTHKHKLTFSYQSAYILLLMAKIDCIYNKSKTNLEYDRLARGQKLSVHQTVGPKSLCQKKKKKMKPLTFITAPAVAHL